MTHTKFGEAFVSLQEFDGEVIRLLGLDYAKRISLWGFREHLERNPEVIVPFDHTIEQHWLDNHITDRIMVRTKAIVLRAQLAIEGPKEKL